MADETIEIHHEPEPQTSPAEAALLQSTAETAAHAEHLVTGHDNLREEIASLREAFNAMRAEHGSTSSEASSIQMELAEKLRQSEERVAALTAEAERNAADLASAAATPIEEPPIESVTPEAPRRQKSGFWKMVLGR